VSGGIATPADGPGTLRIRGLRTAAPAADLDLDVAAGETVGLVVPDPAVAAALLQVLGHEQDPQAGSVELDGVNLAHLPPASARAEVIVAAHDARLFAGTVLENVLAGRSAGPGTDPDVDSAMRAAQADQVADALPDGRDTEIAEQGSSLSGGQRQRVALARALAAQARVLVLHDPTTAVDAVTESRIAAGLREVRAGRTTLLLTTSPALLAAADRVVVLDGDRRAEGSHAELLHTDAAYRELVLS
jgi:putative ABC transport system ATP-binding protein